MLYRERTVNGKTSEQLVYFISSLPPKVRTVAKHLRSHWSVENQLHWSLDVNFVEDASRIRKRNGPLMASIFRRISLSMIKLNTSIKASQRGKRLMAGWNSDLLEEILAGKWTFLHAIALTQKSPVVSNLKCSKTHIKNTYELNGLSCPHYSAIETIVVLFASSRGK